MGGGKCKFVVILLQEFLLRICESLSLLFYLKRAQPFTDIALHAGCYF